MVSLLERAYKEFVSQGGADANDLRFIEQVVANLPADAWLVRQATPQTMKVLTSGYLTELRQLTADVDSTLRERTDLTPAGRARLEDLQQSSKRQEAMVAGQWATVHDQLHAAAGDVSALVMPPAELPVQRFLYLLVKKAPDAKEMDVTELKALRAKAGEPPRELARRIMGLAVAVNKYVTIANLSEIMTSAMEASYPEAAGVAQAQVSLDGRSAHKMSSHVFEELEAHYMGSETLEQESTTVQCILPYSNRLPGAA
jgi:hypothetical protein